ncbi:hypothetical protein D6810_00005, partial [Candidatus Dojkabacteria bacterium]
YNHISEFTMDWYSKWEAKKDDAQEQRLSDFEFSYLLFNQKEATGVIKYGGQFYYIRLAIKNNPELELTDLYFFNTSNADSTDSSDKIISISSFYVYFLTINDQITDVDELINTEIQKLEDVLCRHFSSNVKIQMEKSLKDYIRPYIVFTLKTIEDNSKASESKSERLKRLPLPLPQVETIREKRPGKHKPGKPESYRSPRVAGPKSPQKSLFDSEQ